MSGFLRFDAFLETQCSTSYTNSKSFACVSYMPAGLVTRQRPFVQHLPISAGVSYLPVCFVPCWGPRFIEFFPVEWDRSDIPVAYQGLSDVVDAMI